MAGFHNRFNGVHLEFERDLPEDGRLTPLEGVSEAAPKLLSNPTDMANGLIAIASVRTAPNSVSEVFLVHIGGQTGTIRRTITLHRRLCGKRPRWAGLIGFLEVTLEFCRRVDWRATAAFVFGSWFTAGVLRWLFG